MLRALDRHSLPRDALAAAVKARIGQPLRRASMYSSMALLACLRLIEQEGPPAHALQSTALLWSSVAGPQEETTRLLRAPREDLMPFDFLASQPGLLGVAIAPWLPGLQLALFMPAAQQQRADHGLRSLQWAAHCLREGRYERVICASLERDAQQCHWAALSLAAQGTCAAPQRSMAELAEWLHAPFVGGIPLNLSADALKQGIGA